jgi:hypothetical protein
MRFCLIDGFLDSFSCGLGQIHGHASRASFVGPRLYSCDAFIGSSHVVPLRASCHFFNNHTRSFPRVNISRHASKDETSFLNQNLHHADPHDKLSTIIGDVSKSWVSKYLPTNPLGSKTQTSLSLSIVTCRMEVLGWRT